MVGGEDEAVKPLEPISSRSRRRTATRTSRSGRGALREDDPQRDRVRPDAGLRRGLRDHGALRVRPRHVSRSRASGGTARSSAPGCSSCCTRPSRPTAPKLEDIAPWVEDSGEGRWTINEAINENARAGDRGVALRTLRLPGRDQVLGQGRRRAPQPVRRPRGASRRARQGRAGPALMAVATRQRTRCSRAPGPAHARSVRARDLRRLGRPDTAQALPRALLARVPEPAPGALRDRRRRAHRGDRRRLPAADEAGGCRARPR